MVCEKGLGVNGMTLTTLKEEGFQAVFIGIGELQYSFYIFDNNLLIYPSEINQSSLSLCAHAHVNVCVYVCNTRPPSGQSS